MPAAKLSVKPHSVIFLGLTLSLSWNAKPNPRLILENFTEKNLRRLMGDCSLLEYFCDCGVGCDSQAEVFTGSYGYNTAQLVRNGCRV